MSGSVESSTGHEEESGPSTTSSENRNFNLLSEVYNDTKEIKVTDEMLLLSVEEPNSYEQAVKENEWKRAIESELESIEKNNIWRLTELITTRS